jgi:phosphatidylserine decarboxylase
LKCRTNFVYAAKDATFDFPIYLLLAGKLAVVKLVVWDKDMLMKEYLSKVASLLHDWFRQEGVYAFDDPNNQVCQYSRLCTRCPKLTTFVF